MKIFEKIKKAKNMALNERKYNEALALLDDVLSENENNIGALALKGNIIDLSLLDPYSENTFKKIIELQGKSKNCYLRILELDSVNFKAMIDLGDYEERLSNYTEAINWYDKALFEILKNDDFIKKYQNDLEDIFLAKIEIYEKLKNYEMVKKCKEDARKYCENPNIYIDK